MFVVAATPEASMQGKEDKGLRSLVLDEETTIVADGIGIVKGIKMPGLSVTERILEVDLAEHLLMAAPEIFIKCNLEWLYRLLKRTSRTKRFYNNNVKFIFSLKKIK